jgi:hypothetical protein
MKPSRIGQDGDDRAMGIVEAAKRAFSVLALAAGGCLICACAPAGSWSGDDWRTGEDWRLLRPIDLHAQLVRATWDERSYLDVGHPMQFGRTEVRMQPGGAPRGSTVRSPKNINFGVLVDNLTCYNAIRGERQCALLLNEPNSCYLFVYADSEATRNEDFNVRCPAYLTLGR